VLSAYYFSNKKSAVKLIALSSRPTVSFQFCVLFVSGFNAQIQPPRRTGAIATAATGAMFWLKNVHI
jgi:hypothetical protein